MAYSVAQQIRDRGRQMGIRVRTDEDVERFIAYADADIDSKLDGRYDVPFSPTPALVNFCSQDLALAYILDSVYGESTPNASEFAGRLRTGAYQILDELREGTRTLPGVSRVDEGGVVSNTYDADTATATEKTFTQGDWRSWRAPEEMDNPDEDIDDRF